MAKGLLPILLALIIQANAAPDLPENVCLKIENISDEEASAILRPNIPDIGNQTNQKLKCYAACILEEMDIIDGCSYQLELGKRHAIKTEMHHLMEALDECKDSSAGSERCDCGYNVFKETHDVLNGSWRLDNNFENSFFDLQNGRRHNYNTSQKDFRDEFKNYFTSP